MPAGQVPAGQVPAAAQPWQICHRLVHALCAYQHLSPSGPTVGGETPGPTASRGSGHVVPI